MQWLILIKTVLELVPLLIEVIKSVENAIPDSGKGAEKLAMVRGIIESAYKPAKDAVVTFEQVWPSMEATVRTIVDTFNSTGAFKK